MAKLVRSWSDPTLLVNPKGRRRRKTTTAKQKAAARLNLAKARAARSKHAKYIKKLLKSGTHYREKMPNGKWGVFQK